MCRQEEDLNADLDVGRELKPPALLLDAKQYKTKLEKPKNLNPRGNTERDTERREMLTNMME